MSPQAYTLTIICTYRATKEQTTYTEQYLTLDQALRATELYLVAAKAQDMIVRDGAGIYDWWVGSKERVYTLAVTR